MTFIIDFEQEEDGRWLAEVTDLPGVLAYGQTSDEAITKVKALALRVIADLSRSGWNDFVFAFHDNEELGPRMLNRTAKVTGLRPEDL